MKDKPKRTTPVTPQDPSKGAMARVKDPLPVPTVCPYCDHPVELVTNDKIYGRQYGEWPWAYACTHCDSYVGLHPFTHYPLGTLADAATRQARKEAKDAFNPLWKTKRKTRNEAYAWLAEQMGISPKTCHIGWFDVAQCRRVLYICNKD